MASKIAVIFVCLSVVLSAIAAEKSGSDAGASGLSSITNFNPINNIPNFPGSSGGGGSTGGIPGFSNLAGNQEAFTDFMTLASDPCTWKTMAGFMKLMADANKSQQNSQKS